MENVQGPETANRRPRRFNAKGRRNELEVGVGGAAVSGVDGFSKRKVPGGLRPRRSVVVGSLTMLVGGLVITATAIPVSANAGSTKFASPTTSISTARTSTAAPRVAPSGALVSYSPTRTKRAGVEVYESPPQESTEYRTDHHHDRGDLLLTHSDDHARTDHHDGDRANHQDGDRANHHDNCCANHHDNCCANHHDVATRRGRFRVSDGRGGQL
jgi:hypothetical protein